MRYIILAFFAMHLCMNVCATKNNSSDTIKEFIPDSLILRNVHLGYDYCIGYTIKHPLNDECIKTKKTLPGIIIEIHQCHKDNPYLIKYKTMLLKIGLDYDSIIKQVNLLFNKLDIVEKDNRIQIFLRTKKDSDHLSRFIIIIFDVKKKVKTIFYQNVE